jgi:hypothetical protein
LIPELRSRFNRAFTPERYASLLERMERRCGVPIAYRIAECPIFTPPILLEQMAAAGAEMTQSLLGDPAYLAAARQAIPGGCRVAGETAHPNFLTADFALIRDPEGDPGGALVPRLVEMQAFPSVYGYQTVLCDAYREVFGLEGTLGSFLGGLDEAGYWELLARTVVGGHDPESVVLTEVDPLHQKTRPDFEVTARRLGIAVADISRLEPEGDKLFYRNAAGRRVPIRRLYNRAIADELISRQIRLPFDLTRPWEVEWAGHPNWYFLISKFSLPWLSANGIGQPGGHSMAPPAVFVSDFLDGTGRERLAAAGVPLPSGSGPETVYRELLLKPLFSFAGKGIEFDPTQERLEAIPAGRRAEFLLQQRMSFVSAIETPQGPTQAEIRILYLWPEGGSLTPVLSLARLGRGRMMGVDHNRNQAWVGASAAFFPGGRSGVSK